MISIDVSISIPIATMMIIIIIRPISVILARFYGTETFIVSSLFF